jgi:cytochrome c-type biogenesis protein
MDPLALFLLPLGLGLVGFVEPCTVGSSLLFLKYLEGKATPVKVRETIAFAITRALFIGGLGALAALVGEVFLDIQRAFWIFLGAAYVGLGALYVMHKQGVLIEVWDPASIIWRRREARRRWGSSSASTCRPAPPRSSER